MVITTYPSARELAKGRTRSLRRDQRMAVTGASRPLPLVPAKVSSPNRQRSLCPGRESRAIRSTHFCWVHDPLPGKPP